MVKTNKKKLFRRTKKKLNIKKQKGKGESPIDTDSFQDFFDIDSAPASPNDSPMSNITLSPSQKKHSLTKDEVYEVNQLLQNPKDVFKRQIPLHEIASVAAEAIPSPSSTKRTRKRKLSPSSLSSPSSFKPTRKHKSSNRQNIPIIQELFENKIINNAGNFVPTKSLSRINGFLEDYNHHGDITKSQQFYNAWRKEEASNRKNNRLRRKPIYTTVK